MTSTYFWLGASADAETGHSAKPEPVSRLGPEGECPARECPKVVELFGHLNQATVPLSEGPQLSKAAAERLQQMELLDLQALMDARKHGPILIAGASLAVEA